MKNYLNKVLYMFFQKNEKSNLIDFDYLDSKKFFYFDSACQTLRPQQVIDAEVEYYQEYNACGHRVKYKWGELVDKKVDETRELILKLTGKSRKEYTVAFTLNTTYGINTILHQINPNNYSKIVTSEIEHNSVFLPSITYARRNKIDRLVLTRSRDGSLDYVPNDINNAIVILNSTSNIDGRNLENIEQLSKDINDGGGLLLLDASQSFGHNINILKDTNFDAAFGSSHKMYGPSLGFIIIKKELLKTLDCFFIGGSTVQDVVKDDYTLIAEDEEIYSRIEPGLQNFAGIIGLGEAITWRNNFKKDKKNHSEYEKDLQIYLNMRLTEIDVHLLNESPSSVVSIFSDRMDSHKLGLYLSERNIMCRTGYHCCHYYLKNMKKYPPLFRISLGLNNTKEQIDYLIDSLNILLK